MDLKVHFVSVVSLDYSAFDFSSLVVSIICRSSRRSLIQSPESLDSSFLTVKNFQNTFNHITKPSSGVEDDYSNSRMQKWNAHCLHYINVIKRGHFHPSTCAYPILVSGEAEAYPSCHSARGRVHPERLWTASAEPTTSTLKHLKPPCCEVTVLATTPPSPAHFKARSNVHNMSAVKKTAHQSALKRTYYRLKLWIKIQSEAQLSMLPTQAGWVTVFDTRLDKVF